jgi:hypothetical protein
MAASSVHRAGQATAAARLESNLLAREHVWNAEGAAESYGFSPQFAGISPFACSTATFCMPAKHIIIGFIPLGVSARSLVVLGDGCTENTLLADG